MLSRPSSPSCELRRDPECPVCSDKAVAARKAGHPLTVDSVGNDVPFAMTMTGPRRHGLARGPRMTTVYIPAVLRATVGGAKSLELDGGSIRAVVDALVTQHPSLGGQLLTEDGDLNRFVNVYVNGQDVRYLEGLDTPVAATGRGPAAAGDGRGLTDGRRLAARRRRRTRPRRTPTRRWSRTAAGTPTSSRRSATRHSSRSRG